MVSEIGRLIDYGNNSREFLFVKNIETDTKIYNILHPTRITKVRTASCRAHTSSSTVVNGSNGRCWRAAAGKSEVFLTSYHKCTAFLHYVKIQERVVLNSILGSQCQ